MNGDLGQRTRWLNKQKSLHFPRESRVFPRALGGGGTRRRWEEKGEHLWGPGQWGPPRLSVLGPPLGLLLSRPLYSVLGVQGQSSTGWGVCTMDTYSLTVWRPESEIKVCTGQVPSAGSEGDSSRPLPWLLGVCWPPGVFIGLKTYHPDLCSIFTWPSYSLGTCVQISSLYMDASRVELGAHPTPA